MSGRGHGAYVHFVQNGESLSRIVQRHFHLQSGGDIARKVQEVARLSHIEDPDRVRPGQAVVLAVEPPVAQEHISVAPPASKVDLQELSRQFEGLSPTEKQVITRNWNLLETVASGGQDAGVALSRFADAHGLGPDNDVFGGAVGGVSRLAKACESDPTGAPRRIAALLQPQVEKRAARNSFHDETYDFRGKVGPVVYGLCFLAAWSGIVGLILIAAAVIIDALTPG